MARGWLGHAERGLWFHTRWSAAPAGLVGWLVATGVSLTALVAPARAQTNFLAWNNGSEASMALPGTTSPVTNPNLYYRCFPSDVLYAPQDSSAPGLEVAGVQLALTSFFYIVLPSGCAIGTPLVFFVEDPSRACILSAAIGGGFPPNQAKILQSPNTLAAFSYYGYTGCYPGYAWWLSFTGSTALFQAPDPSAGGGNLLVGWSGLRSAPNMTFSTNPPLYSRDEAAAAQSLSFVNLNGAGQGLRRLTSQQEWAIEPILLGPTVQPELLRMDGTWDLGGAGGYSPAVGPGRQIRFRTMDTAHAGTAVFPIHVANLSFQASPDACHLPGQALFGMHLPVNVDFFWLLVAPLLQGPVLSPPSWVGAYWNPNSGWSPGGESVSPPLPVSLPGLLGLQMCFGSYAFDPAGPPFVVAASNGSTLRFR